MTDKDRQSQRRRAEDQAFNRMLLWLLGAVVAELVILLVKHFYVDMTGASLSIAIASGFLAFFRVYRFAGVALTAAGLVWVAAARRGGKRVLLPGLLTGVVAFLWVVSMTAYYLFDEGIRILMMVPAIGGILILIYFLYQRSFFVNAVLTGGGIAAVWLYREYYMNHPTAITLCFFAGWVALAAAALLCWKLRSGGGKLGGRQLMPPRSHYGVTWITCGVVAVLMALCLALGDPAALYLLFGLIGWLFCQAVYFTVKLM